MIKTEWSNLEIAGSYRRSGENPRQIRIIAECNACSNDKIKEILIEQGFIIKEREKKKMARTKKEDQKISKAEETSDDIILIALNEKKEEIADKLLVIAGEINKLKKQEEELTKQFSVLEEFVKNKRQQGEN